MLRFDYNFGNLHQATQTPGSIQTTPPEREFVATVTLPYIKGVSESIRRMLAKAKSGTTIRSMLTSVKLKREPDERAGVVYRILCKDCDKSIQWGDWKNS